MSKTLQSYIIQEGTGDGRELEKYKTCFDDNGSPKNLAVLKWFHQNNLRQEQSILYGLEKETGKIAAIYTYLPVTFKLLDRKVKGLQSFDTLTDVNHRGKGLFVQLAAALEAREAERGNELIYGFPNDNSTHGFVNKLGFTYFGEVPFLIKPLRFSYFLKKLIKKSTPSEDIACALESPEEISVKTNIKLKKINEFGQNYQTLWDESVSRCIPIGVSRNAAYMNWRYIQKPDASYVRYGYYENNILEGIIIFALKKKHGGRIGYIMELLYNPSKPEAGITCLNFANRILKKHNTDVLLSWCYEHSFNYNAYKKSGFFSFPEKIRPQKLGVIVKVLKSMAEKEILTRKNWYISYSDSDTV